MMDRRRFESAWNRTPGMSLVIVLFATLASQAAGEFLTEEQATFELQFLSAARAGRVSGHALEAFVTAYAEKQAHAPPLRLPLGPQPGAVVPLPPPLHFSGEEQQEHVFSLVGPLAETLSVRPIQEELDG